MLGWTGGGYYERKLLTRFIVFSLEIGPYRLRPLGPSIKGFGPGSPSVNFFRYVNSLKIYSFSSNSEHGFLFASYLTNKFEICKTFSMVGAL